MTRELSLLEIGLTSESVAEPKKYSFILPPLYKPRPSFAVGDVVLNRYVVKELFHGAMGDVYRCYDNNLRYDVAVKTVISDKRSNLQQIYFFAEEAQKRLKMDPHPNVTTLKLVENINGYLHIISEWVDGDEIYGNSLDSWIKSYPFTPEEIVSLMLQLCDGLAHCCQQLSTPEEAFVLRDLKPENILVSKDHVYKLMDFSTHASTEGWESPEQLAGQRLDPRSDIYALGLVASTVYDTMQTEDQKSPLGHKLKELIMRCKTPDLDLRMPSYETLRCELSRLCEEFSLPTAPAKQPKNVFLTSLYRLYSEINMGWIMPCATSLSDRCYARCLASKNYLNMQEYMEYTRLEDRNAYEAEALRRNGQHEKALETLGTSPDPRRQTPKFFYVRGLIERDLGKIDEAVLDFERAAEKELFAPALDALAELLMQYSNLRNAPGLYEYLQNVLSRMERDAEKNAAGYLMNQVHGKLFMLLGEYRAASLAFQESLNYPNPDEWENLYHLGMCEFYQNNTDIARAVLSCAAQVISSDPNCMSSWKKAVTLLFCYYTLGDEKETERLVTAVYEKYHWDYRNLLTALRQKKS